MRSFMISTRIIKSRRSCSTKGGEEEREKVTGGKARGKETTRKTKT
jgi:hypothetical protein